MTKLALTMVVCMMMLLACQAPIMRSAADNQALNLSFIVSGSANSVAANTGSRLLIPTVRTLIVTLSATDSSLPSVPPKTVSIPVGATRVDVSIPNVAFGTYTVTAQAFDAGGTLQFQQTATLSVGIATIATPVALNLLPINDSKTTNFKPGDVLSGQLFADSAVTICIPATSLQSGGFRVLVAAAPVVYCFSQDSTGTLYPSTVADRKFSFLATKGGDSFITLYNSSNAAVDFVVGLVDLLASQPKPVLTGFNFPAQKVSGVILSNSVAALLPVGTALNNLVPSFAAPGAFAVTVNGVVQTSGFSAVDFSGPVNYVVTSPDGTSQTYTVSATTLNTGLVVYYPFSGNPMDYSGNGFNASGVNNFYTIDRLSSANGSLAFDGKISSLIGGSAAMPIASPISVSTWINIQSINTGLTWFAYSANMGFSVSQTMLGLNFGISTPSSSMVSSPQLAAGWHQYIGMYDGVTISLYIDGSLAATTPMSGKVSDTGPLVFGYKNTTYWPGTLDGFRIYNRILSTAEIAALQLFVD